MTNAPDVAALRQRLEAAYRELERLSAWAHGLYPLADRHSHEDIARAVKTVELALIGADAALAQQALDVDHWKGGAIALAAQARVAEAHRDKLRDQAIEIGLMLGHLLGPEWDGAPMRDALAEILKRWAERSPLDAALESESWRDKYETQKAAYDMAAERARVAEARVKELESLCEDEPTLGEALETVEARLIKAKNGLYPEDIHAVGNVLQALATVPGFERIGLTETWERSTLEAALGRLEQEMREFADERPFGLAAIVRQWADQLRSLSRPRGDAPQP